MSVVLSSDKKVLEILEELGIETGKALEININILPEAPITITVKRFACKLTSSLDTIVSNYTLSEKEEENEG